MGPPRLRRPDPEDPGPLVGSTPAVRPHKGGPPPGPGRGCGHGWLSGGYTVGTLSYGEEESKFKLACLT
jgi:hypothetical protein